MGERRADPGFTPPVSVEGVRDRLIEVEVRYGLGIGEVEVRGLVEEELALGRGSVGMKARILMSPPQAEHRSGSTS